MNAEKVILHSIEITKRAQIQSFQIRIPADAKKIIGIETSLRGLEWIGQFVWDPPMYEFLRARPVFVAGYLRLQSPGEQNLFFNEDIRLHDNQLLQGDFSQSMTFRALQWLRGNRREEIPLAITGEPVVIFGWYEDRYTKLWDQDIPYTVNIYLWYSTN